MKFAPYTSGRLKQLKVGITSYSEEKTPFEVVGSVSVGGSITVNKSITVNNIAITSTTSVSEFSNLNISGVSTFGSNAFFNGNVAIGTDSFNAPVGAGNTSILAVGILTANRIYSTVYGEFTGGSVVADNIVGTALSISGISTLGGNVGIGTTDPTKAVGAGNTAILAVGILTAYRIYSTLFGEFTGGSVVADNIVGTGLSISGISTLGTVQISSGIITATSGVVTYFGDGSNLTGTGNTTNVRTDSLVVSGVSTFNDNVNLPDNKKIQLGDNGDLQLYHNGTSSYIDNNTGAFYIRNNVDDDDGGNIIIEAKSGKASAVFQDDEGVRLYYNDAEKIATTGYGVTVNGTTQTQQLNVTGFSTFSNLVDVNAELNTQGGRIVGAATSNVIPFLYANYSDLPNASTYHGAFAHVHATGRAYYAHAGNWFELVNKEADGTVGTGTERYNIGQVDATSLDVSGISTFTGNVSVGSSLIITTDKKLILGPSGYQFEIYSNTGGNYLKSPSGGIHNLVDGSFTVKDITDTNYRIEAKANEVDLYAIGSKKFSTTGYGVTVLGTTQTQQLNASGISTLANTVVGGATTELLVTGDARVTGELKVGDGTITLNSAGISTFPTGVNIGQVSISTATASSFPFDVKVGSAITFFGGTGIVTATSYRGDGSELVGVAKSSVLEDSGINPLGVSTFNNLDVTGITTIAGNLVANGNIIGDNATNISGINSVTATSFHGDGSGLENVGVDTGTINTDSLKVSGISTFTGNIDANGQLDVDGLTNLDDLIVTGFGTFSNTLKVGSTLDVDGAADIAGHLELGSSVNIAGVTTIAGDITVGGNITGDGSTVISGVTSVVATKFYGNGENLTGINADTIGDLSHLKVTGLSTFVGNAQFDGNVSIAGTLTYEDVTNVDSIGVITARSGIVVGAGISAVGIVTASGFVGSGSSLTALNANNLSSGVVPDARFPATLPAASGANLTSLNASELTSGTVPDARFPATLPAASGVNLTNVSAVFATKAGIATYTSSWTVTANGSSHYRFAGPGNLSTQDDPTIYLVRGQQYEFDLNASGHPFLIRVGSGGTQYTDGVTTVGNNQTGKIRFDVPMDAPSELFYQCQYHSNMFGKFEITDGSKIVQGNSKVEVVDTGSNGYVKVETEGTERLRIDSSGHVVPGTDSQYDIGTNTVRFANIYGDVLYGDGSNLTGITAGGVGAIGGLTVKDQSGAVVGTAGSIATIDFNNSTGVTVTASSGAAGIASVVIAGVGTDTSINTTGIITATFSGDGQDLDKVSIGSTDGNFIGKGYLQAQKTVNAGGDRGDANIILGRFAGCCHDGSSYNVYLGDQAGRKSSSSSTNRNVFIGCQAGCGNTTGYHNVFLGSEAGKGVCGDSGSMNLFAGLQAGIRNTGCYNIAFGKMAYGRETGTKNIAIGFGAANDVGAGGTSNVFIGEYAGNNAQVNGPPCRGGISNVYVGTHAGYQNPGDFNIGIGEDSLNGNSSQAAGYRNIALGQCSGNTIQNGVDNIMIGSCSGAKITWGYGNILLGCNSGCFATGIFYNTYIGVNAGKNVCGGGYDVALGLDNLCDSRWACNNIAIGRDNLQKANACGPGADALFNIAIGDNVGAGLTTGAYNFMVGNLAGYCLTCGSENIIFGKKAGWKASGSTRNIFIGCYAGKSIGTAGCAGNSNIAIGDLAGSQVSSTSDRNVFIGNRAGVEATGGCFNVALGADAATYLTGDRNIFIGQYSGFNQNVSGDKNVVIGDAVCLLSATGSSQLVIGAGATHWIDGDSSFNVTLAGVATATKSTGVFEATKFCGDGSCLTNVTATEATNFTVTANNSTDETVYPVFVDGATGSQGAETDTGLFYNPSSGILSATKYCGDGSCLTGISAGFLADSNENLYAGTSSGEDSSTNTCFNIGIGYSAGANLNGNFACYNVLMGHKAGNAITIGGNNIAIGCDAAALMTEGACNIAIGKQALGKCTVTASSNIAIGCLAGQQITSGNTNIFIGNAAGYQSTDAYLNLFIGDAAGGYVSGNANRNIALGHCAGYRMTTGRFNIMLGNCTAKDGLLSGDDNIIFGRQAGLNVSSGSYNTFIGPQAGKNFTTGQYNVVLGGAACQAGTATGGENVLIGNYAARCINGNAGNNIALGRYALGSLNHGLAFEGNSNLALGMSALPQITSGNRNIGLGSCAGRCTTTGDDNIFIGCYSGHTHVSGDKNVAIGVNVSLASTSGSCQLAIGVGSNKWICGDSSFNVTLAGIATVTKATGVVEATKFCGDGSCLTGISAGLSADAQGNLFANNTCSGCNFSGSGAFHNTLFGSCTGKSLTTGDDNVILGCESGCSLTFQTANILLGKAAGKETTGHQNIFIGCLAGTFRGNSCNNIAIGGGALRGSSTVSDNTSCFNIAIGRAAGRDITSGQLNVFIGDCVGTCATTGSFNTFIGNRIGLNPEGGQRNVLIGSEITNNHGFAGDNNIIIGDNIGQNCCFTNNADLNIFIGNEIAQTNSTLISGACNIAIGKYAARCLESGDYNIVLGLSAGCSLTSGNSNISLGRNAGCAINTGSYNILFGDCAGKQITTGRHNVVMGKDAMSSGGGQGGDCNVTLGYAAGCLISFGSRNILLGACAGKTTSSGTNNIAIGYNVTLPSATGNCQLAIGNDTDRWIVGDSNFNVGIGTTNPKTDLQVGSYYGVVGGGGTFTAAAGVAHTINEYTIASTDFKTAEYTIFANTGSKIQSQKLLVMQDGTTAYSQEYAVMSSDTLLVSADATLASGVVKIEITPETGVSGLTTFRFTRHTML